MRTFDYDGLIVWDNEILDMMIKVHEANERCKQYYHLDLDRMIDVARKNSIYASNAIEGIFASDSRYKNLIAGATPKNEDERLIAGYNNALYIIEENFSNLLIEPSTIKYLHSMLYPENNGEYKKVDNVIVSVDIFGNQKVIFKPLEHYYTYEAMEQICHEYNNSKLPSLLLIPLFVHDFLCIHPFDDGNGRTSRLLTFLLLYMSGFQIVKYVSLDKYIWKFVKQYYATLNHCGTDWRTENTLPLQFVKYFLSQLLNTYAEFEEKIQLIKDNPQATEAVRRTFSLQAWQHKYEVAEHLPTIGIKSVEAALNKLTKEGFLTKVGSGNRTFYKKLSY